MQLQASYIIRQLKQLLKHVQRKYKYVLNRIERILDKEEDYQYFCIEFHLNLRLLQLAAINRLLQRNLIKKYKYQLSIIEFMVEVAVRDLSYCHHALKEKIKEKTIFTRFNSANRSNNTFTLNTHAKSLDEHCPTSTQSRNYSIKINAGLDNQHKLKRFLRKFFEVANRSVLLIMQSFVIYRFDFEEDALNEYLKNQSEAKFSNISGAISLISVYLFHAKLLFLSQDTNSHIRCEQYLEQAIEKLIDAMHQINISSSKASGKEGGYGRYQKWRQQCQKMIVIALVLDNKVKMKLGKETIGLAGIQLFQSYLQGLPPSLKNFRRLMLPELYLQEQFLRYRAEKTELAQIVAPFFWERTRQIEETNREREFSRHRLMDFYNKRNVKMSEKGPVKPKILLSQLTTAKSLMATTRHKNNMSVQSKATKERSSYNCKNKIITNMIIADITDINAHYLKSKKASPSQHVTTAILNPKKQSSKSHFYKNNTQNVLKRQAVSSRTRRNDSKEDDSLAYQTQRQRQLFFQERQYQNYVNRQRDRLTRKKKQSKLQFKQNEMHLQEEMTAIKENVEGYFMANCRYTEQKSIDIEERDVRKNVVAITSRKKTEIFVQILFHNKDVLGIRKITQKIESLRKKEQEKAKLTTNRLTSSINREQIRGQIFKFQVIAKEIIRKHISFAYDRPPIQRTAADCLETKRKLIQANYTLGQRSIEAVKEKLECKLNKSQYPVDKYLKNQQIFKLKLKKLGTTNFILKKNTQEKVVKQSKELVESVEMDEILEAV